jgi:hypothetical protein
MLRQRDCGDLIGLKGIELMANKFYVRGSEKLRKIMGRTRGVFSSPKSEGARGFKSPSLRQAGSDLRHSLENPAASDPAGRLARLDRYFA